MGQRWFFFFPSIEDELFALPRSTSTRYILRVVETAIPFPVTRGRRTTIIRKFVSRSCIWNEGKLGGEQFEKNYRSPRGSRETLATNWLRGYPRATVLCTCSPLLRRRNFVKSPASGSRELLRIMRTTSLSLSKLSLISNRFQLSPPLLVIRIWNDACRSDNLKVQEKKLEYNGIRARGKKGNMEYSSLSDNGVILKNGGREREDLT